MLSEKYCVLSLLGPSADAFNGDPNTDVINTENLEEVSFFVWHKGGTTGKATITVLAASSVTPSNTEAIAFTYRHKETGASDTWGAVTACASTGLSTVAKEDTLIEIMIKADELPAGKPFVCLNLNETVDDPVAACVLVVAKPRYSAITQPSVLA